MKPFHDMTREELQEVYSEMLATANDLGYTVPGELLYEGEDGDTLMSVCTELHQAIEKFRAGIDSKDESPPVKAPEGKKPKEKKPSTRAAEAGGKTPQKAQATPKPKPNKAAQVSKTEPASKADTSGKESTMSAKTAKKTAAKKAPAKKTAAKKAPAKKAKAPVGKKVTRSPARGFPENAKIKVLAKENPCREGTPRHERVQNLFKHDGKLVSDFLAKGGRTGTVRFSANKGWIKIV